ncbi:MAG TPA: HNH endonuclease [Jatrophihabitans sp.]|uniref:HNH endonuclease n=1 Tax=Jatrophihabitans sp. TaxID=1932789 RepID=UPI002EE9105E
MRTYVGVTDTRWYRFLAARPHLEEVNFWRPGGDRRFGALTPGEPFLFKTHSPHNQVVGGGFYSEFASLHVSEAWEFFGEGNGAESLQELRIQVGRYRAQPIAPEDDPKIGCVFIRDTRLFAPEDTVGPPPDFASNIVQGKTYDLTTSSTASYFEAVMRRLLDAPANPAEVPPWHRPGPVYGDPRLTPYRLGQHAFQAKVLDAYSRRCSITGDKIRPVLQAAHIRPLPVGGEHRLDNGLLLRSDVHTLFDRGYLGVDPKYRLLVSRRLREEFGNGEQFYARAGQTISVPERRHDRPNPEFLEWHADEVFRAS